VLRTQRLGVDLSVLFGHQLTEVSPVRVVPVDGLLKDPAHDRRRDVTCPVGRAQAGADKDIAEQASVPPSSRSGSCPAVAITVAGRLRAFGRAIRAAGRRHPRALPTAAASFGVFPRPSSRSSLTIPAGTARPNRIPGWSTASLRWPPSPSAGPSSPTRAPGRPLAGAGIPRRRRHLADRAGVPGTPNALIQRACQAGFPATTVACFAADRGPITARARASGRRVPDSRIGADERGTSRSGRRRQISRSGAASRPASHPPGELRQRPPLTGGRRGRRHR